MPEPINTLVLKVPIQSMPVSLEFKRMAGANGFVTLQDILNTSLNDLHKLPQSGYRMLKELADILEKNGLDELLAD